MISEFFTATDYEKLKQCMNEYFNWFDNCMQMERNKKEKQFINLIKNGVISENWVNGKIGKFTFDNTRFEYRFLEGMRDYQDKDEILQQPVLSCGFVAWLIKHWGEDTPAIYSGYLQAKLNDYKAEHKKDADVLNRNLEREFYDQYRSEEEQWVKQSEAIFDFISEPEVNKIKEYVKYYFKHVSQFETKGKTDKVNIGKEQPYRVELDKETESKVLETYRFWNSTEKYIQTRTPIITNNIFKDTTQKEFLEMVSAADFSKLYNTKGIKQRVGQNIVALSKIINSDEWTGQATTKLNTTIRALQKNTQFHEYEDLKNKFIQ
jgi:hypothetical protein